MVVILTALSRSRGEIPDWHWEPHYQEPHCPRQSYTPHAEGIDWLYPYL